MVRWALPSGATGCTASIVPASILPASILPASIPPVTRVVVNQVRNGLLAVSHRPLAMFVAVAGDPPAAVITVMPAALAASTASLRAAERGPAMDIQMTAEAIPLRALWSFTLHTHMAAQSTFIFWR